MVNVYLCPLPTKGANACTAVATFLTTHQMRIYRCRLTRSGYRLEAIQVSTSLPILAANLLA